jgi:uncharacterized protein (TIGR00255 family)
MTGFAAAEVNVGSQKLVWEIRSVNHRYLDLGFRLPEELRALEPKLRTAMGEVVKRGKVDCTLKLVSAGGGQAEAALNAEALARLRALEDGALGEFPGATPLSVLEILRWPGVLEEEAGRGQVLMEPALASFAQASASLREARQREGARLAELLRERLDAIEALLVAVDSRLAEAAPRYRDKLIERLAKLDVEADPERLAQEVALIAQRVDVSEEADRLKGHLTEIRDVLGQSEPIGRRLDFLIQELNREANTLASKVQDNDLARRAVDLKVLIEQMREQAQNVE